MEGDRQSDYVCKNNYFRHWWNEIGNVRYVDDLSLIGNTKVVQNTPTFIDKTKSVRLTINREKMTFAKF